MALVAGIELLHCTLESRPFGSRKQQLRDLLAPLFVLLTVPIHLALDGLVRSGNGRVTVAWVLPQVFCFLFLCFGSPYSLLFLRQAVPAMTDDTRDMTMIPFNTGRDLLLCPDGGSIDHERVSRAGNTFGS